jgi:beta-phosphoglucomutase
MKNRRGVLWDLDGVLVDTGEFHFHTWVETLAENGIPFTREQFQSTFGMNNMGILTILLGRPPEPDQFAKIGDAKERRFRQAIRGSVVPLPGVLAWLERLGEMGIRQAVASSAPYENVEALVDELEISSFFDALVSGSGMPGKPKPDVFLYTARQINVLPKRCVVVEDAIAGVTAAKHAGMKCIAVTTTNPAEALSEADIVVDGLDGLQPDVIEQMLAPLE